MGQVAGKSAVRALTLTKAGLPEPLAPEQLLRAHRLFQCAGPVGRVDVAQ